MASSTATDEQNKPVTGYPATPSQIVTGYPQVAPPPPSGFYTAAPYYHQPPRPHYYPNRRRRSSSFLCRMIAAFLTVFLIIGSIFFIVWLVLRPRIPEFRVSSASVSPLNATASELSASWDLSILVSNPNHKLTVFYDHFQISVVYGGDFLLSETELPPFFQTKRNQSLVGAHLSVVGANVGDDVVRAIRGDQSRGSVSFSLVVRAWVRFKSAGWRTREHLMRVYCDDVNIGYSSNNGPGTLLNPSKECDVTM